MPNRCDLMTFFLGFGIEVWAAILWNVKHPWVAT
jgi:hypothetical protein